MQKDVYIKKNDPAVISAYMRDIESCMRAVLPGFIDKLRYISITEQYLLNNSGLLACCENGSLKKSILDIAAMGLELGTALNHASIIAVKPKEGPPRAKLLIEYQGFIELCYRSNKVLSLAARAVYKADRFDYEYGTNKRLKHIPALANRGGLIAAYAIAQLKGDKYDFEIIDHEAAMAARADSNTPNTSSSPWVKREASMWGKTAMRRLLKRLPLSAEVKDQKKTLDDPKTGKINDQEYHHAKSNSPDLHANALKILQIEKPSSDTEARQILNLMRYLYKANAA
jgi:recombination protein RecT